MFTHSVCPLQSRSGGCGNGVEGKAQGLACGSMCAVLQEGMCPDARFLLPQREESHSSAGIIWISLLVMYINYKFKLYVVLYSFHLSSLCLIFGRNVCVCCPSHFLCWSLGFLLMTSQS